MSDIRKYFATNADDERRLYMEVTREHLRMVAQSERYSAEMEVRLLIN